MVHKSHNWRHRDLRSGLIFEIAREAGIEVQGDKDKRPILCPFHEDRHESAFLSANNVYYCSVCTPDGGWSAKTLARELGVPWITDRGARFAFAPARRRPRTAPRARPRAKTQPDGPPFTAEDAESAWSAALSRARDPAPDDKPAIEYLRGRGLLDAREAAAVGLLAPDMLLHPSIQWWPRRGFRLISPLFDQAGRLINIQARSITYDRLPEAAKRRSKKVRFPTASVARGARFASASALQLLRGGDPCDRVLVGEGLTDHLALCLTAPIPVMSAPGTGGAVACIGPWASGRNVYLALDDDQAGDNALPAAAARVHEMGGTPFRIEWPERRKDACQVLEKDGRAALIRVMEQL